MAQTTVSGSLPCLFCGKAFRSLRGLTTHLDAHHDSWVQTVMARLGLASPGQYPIEEYRRALVQALLAEQLPAPGD